MAAAPKRLLFLLNDAPFFISHRLSVAIAARETGWEVHVAAPVNVAEDEVAVAAIEQAGVHFHAVPLNRGGMNPIAEFRLMVAYWKLMRALRPDLVHGVAMKPGAYGGTVARLLRVPGLVIAVTGLGFLFLRETAKTQLLRHIVLSLYGFAFGHANCRAIFQNPDDLALFQAAKVLGKTPVHMIRGCGVDLAKYAPSPEPEEPPVVVFPARIIADKGIHEFIAAVRILKSQGTAARFVLIGRTDPDNPTDVGEDHIRQWESEELVAWQGFSNEMPRVFRDCHIVCLPSYREGLPRTLIEAAACERAIVTADVPGCREIVRDGENGLLVPARDGAATADALRRLIDDADLRRTMARRGRAYAEAEFSVQKFVDDSLAVYEEVSP